MDFGYKKLYINGELVDSVDQKTKKVICPGTEEAVAEIAWAGKKDAELALEAAKVAFKKWSKMSVNMRKKWMDKLRDAVILREQEIRETVMYEMGKTYNQAMEDYETVVNALEWYPQEMLHRRDEIIPDPDGTHAHQIVKQAAGVAVGYLAWNFPLLNLGFKIGPALAAGCTLILKPSASAPLSAYLIGEILESIDFPKGVVNILAGSNEEVALTLSSSPIPRVITMIGSSVSGRIAMQQAATSIKHFSMELGGNAPFIVFEDADLIVVNKPAGMVVHPSYGNYTGTMVHALLYHTKELSGFNGDYRAGIVHRIDKDTTGLLVIAKNEEVHAHIAKQFAAHTTEREYWALCWGKFKNSSGEILANIARSKYDRKLFSVSETEGKIAHTYYEVITWCPYVQINQNHSSPNDAARID